MNARTGIVALALLSWLLCACSSSTSSGEGDGGAGSPRDGSARDGSASWLGESCNDGLDDDGDGRVDEGCACEVSSPTQRCYGGLPSRAGIGACSWGTQRCNVDSEFREWGECEGWTGPSADTCDGIDNDCDPATSDGSAEASLGRACDGGDVDLCADGSIVCDGGALVCGDELAAPVEVCNGEDDDCNPATPDGEADPSRAAACDDDDDDLCARGQLTCVSGTLVCLDDEDADPELCNGIDDDCDGDVDEGVCACNNGVDDDGDGLVDVDDPGCETPLDDSEASASLPCDNGLDDDGDGLIDHRPMGGDPGCSSALDPDERGVTAVATGVAHSCAILDDATVRCWGPNTSGELGYEDTLARGTSWGLPLGPGLAEVRLGSSLGAPTRAASISASPGGAHTCIVSTAGTVKCWGVGANGRLGYGDTAPRGSTASTMGDALPDVALASVATSVSAGWAHSCAVLDTGAVQCWGTGAGGTLGSGSIADSTLPRTVDLGTGLRALSVGCGQNFSCALLRGAETNVVKCWGQNNLAQLGLGDSSNRGDNPAEMGDALPPLTLNLPPGVEPVAVDVGHHHACALLSDGAVRCWGENGSGQCGRDTISCDLVGGELPFECPDRLIGDVSSEMWELPSVSLGTGVRAVAVSANRRSTCVRTDAGEVRCWGANTVGHFGAGIPDDVVIGRRSGQMGDALVSSLFAPRTTATVDGAENHMCVVFTSGELACLGGAELLGLRRVTNLGSVASELGPALPLVPLW